MATPAPVNDAPIALLQGKAVVTKWSLGNDDTGIGERRLAAYADRTVAATGTFSSATIAIQGSLDSTDGIDGNWFALTDPQGNALSGKTAAFLEAISEWAVWVRPVSAGGVGAAIVVTIAGKNNA